MSYGKVYNAILPDAEGKFKDNVCGGAGELNAVSGGPGGRGGAGGGRGGGGGGGGLARAPR
jgi:hypothetical protein